MKLLLGPYLSTIFTKLEQMPENSLYVNLQLTGLLSQLASYPHPLLHSLLLNASLVFQPSVRSLIQVKYNNTWSVFAILACSSTKYFVIIIFIIINILNF